MESQRSNHYCWTGRVNPVLDLLSCKYAHKPYPSVTRRKIVFLFSWTATVAVCFMVNSSRSVQALWSGDGILRYLQDIRTIWLSLRPRDCHKSYYYSLLRHVYMNSLDMYTTAHKSNFIWNSRSGPIYWDKNWVWPLYSVMFSDLQLQKFFNYYSNLRY